MKAKMHYHIPLAIHFAAIPRSGFWTQNSIRTCERGLGRSGDNPLGNVGTMIRQTGLAHPGKVDRAFDGHDSILYPLV